MTAMFPHRCPKVCSRQSYHRRKNPNRKNLSISEYDSAQTRKWFADLLWETFPGRSENEVADAASRALGRSKRQVRNYLRCEHDASFSTVAKVLVIAGAEIVLQDPDRP